MVMVIVMIDAEEHTSRRRTTERSDKSPLLGHEFDDGDYDVRD